MGTTGDCTSGKERQIWEIFEESVGNITKEYDDALAKANAQYKEFMNLARKNYDEGIARVRGQND